MKRIFMEYPNMFGDNELYDGRTHLIKPVKIYGFKVGDFDLALLYYYDEIDAVNSCMTFLIKIDGQYVKIPLSSYENFDDLVAEIMQTFKVKEMSLDVLPATIKRTEVLSPETFTSFIKENVLDLEYYYAYRRSEPTDYQGRIYRSSGVIMYYGEDQKYIFSKEGLTEEAGLSLMQRMRETSIAARLNMSYDVDFSIRYQKGDTRVIYVPDGEQILAQVVYMIPGIHHYHVFVSPCTESLDPLSVASRGCTIEADSEEYHDLHDRKAAFRDGFKGLLPIHFDREPDVRKRHHL